jgi:hypothetical protein
MKMRGHEKQFRVSADLANLAHDGRAVAWAVSTTSVALVPTTIPMFGTSTTFPSGITYEWGASLTVTFSLTMGSGRFCGGCCAAIMFTRTTTPAAAAPTRTDGVIVMQGF